MNRKQRALKALVILAVVVALCMFFSRTVQTITTPKVRRVSAVKGKLEQKFALTGAVHFEEVTPCKITDAQKLPITVDSVLVRPGYYVQKGDVLFTARAPEYEAKMAELREKYTSKVDELATEHASNLRLAQSSVHNDAFNALQDATRDYYDARYGVLAAAQQAAYTLPPESEWAAIADAAPELSAALRLWDESAQARDAAAKALRRIYESDARASNNTFEYIKKMDELREETEAISAEMLSLDALAQSLTSVVAPHAGYITAIELKEGDTYDGSKAAFEISAEDAQPVLRVNVSRVDKTLPAGCKADIGGAVSGEVREVTVSGEGEKLAVIALDAGMIKSLGGMTRLLGDNEIDVTLTYKAQKNATLLPASAVRSDGGDAYYVYIVERSYGGILDASGYKVVRCDVNVIEKSDQLVALSDDMSYREIADREDRALKDGQAVMDYVD